MKFICSFLFFIGCCWAANGQVHVKGVVTRHADGKPLGGVSIYFEHTSVGTVTDSAGAFSLSISTANRNTLQLIASHIGFKTHVENIAVGNSNPFLNIALNEKTTTLQEVVITANEKNGWRKWGELFTELFIGTSAYAKHCTLLNKEALRFVYSKTTNTLHVYADEPLIIENQSLGYSIRIDLEKFSYDLNKKYLFYEIHSFYQQLPVENISDLKKWEKNRLDVFVCSPMHFYRTLFDSSYAKQGFEIHRVINPDLFEWERISILYQQHTSGSAGTSTSDFEKSLNSDTLKYYRKILNQGPAVETIDPRPVHFYEFASVKDSNTVLLNFTGRLALISAGKDAPHEYLLYTGAVAAPGQPARQTNAAMLKPSSVLELTNGMPVEVYANGALKNDDLLITGYFAWLNKMATSLPFDYDPQTVLLKTRNK